MKKLFTKKGQSTLEYVVVLMGILAAIILAVKTFAPANASTGLGKVYSNVGTRMESATARIASMVN
jgi:uncharacterized protein (UPF0333 family)